MQKINWKDELFVTSKKKTGYGHEIYDVDDVQ